MSMHRLAWLACVFLFFGPGLNANLYASEVPNLYLQTKQGRLQLSDLRGKVVYLDFWASWCVPCRKSFPWMNEMHRRYSKDGLKIIAVNLDKEEKLAKQFLAEYPASFIIAYDPEGSSAESFKVQAMPSSFLIDKQGHLRKTHLGFMENERATMEAEIKQLLGK